MVIDVGDFTIYIDGHSAWSVRHQQLLILSGTAGTAQEALECAKKELDEYLIAVQKRIRRIGVDEYLAKEHVFQWRFGMKIEGVYWTGAAPWYNNQSLYDGDWIFPEHGAVVPNVLFQKLFSKVEDD